MSTIRWRRKSESLSLSLSLLVEDRPLVRFVDVLAGFGVVGQIDEVPAYGALQEKGVD